MLLGDHLQDLQNPKNSNYFFKPWCCLCTECWRRRSSTRRNERVNWLIDWRRQYYLFYLKTFAAVLTTKISINVTMCCCGVYVKNLIQKQLTHNMTHSTFGSVIFYPFTLSPLAYYCFLYCEYFLSLFTNAARIYIHYNIC